MANYALLGTIVFDLLSAPESLDERHAASFAEHSVLSGKPKLQAMGMELAELNLKLQLHHQLAPVESRYQALLAAQASQEPLALVLGFSKFKGHFVITDVSSQALFTDSQGNALAREISLSLREFAGDVQKGLWGSALSLGGNSPLTSIIPKGLSNFVEQATQMISRGVKIARQAKQVISEVKSTLAVVKNLRDNPLAALNELGAVVQSLGGSVGGLAEMAGLGEAFKAVTAHVSGASAFMDDLTALSSELNSAYSLFKSGLNGSEMGEWFDLGVQAIDSAEAISDTLANYSAKLTAWIAVRHDTQEDVNE
ncbi:phage tail protein [Pasteurellaceae bacterium RH1A]|nr:phage tail protein [Pasteurellaceae bacterium RH1A]